MLNVFFVYRSVTKVSHFVIITYKQMLPLVALASLRTEPHYEWQGSMFVVTVHATEEAFCPF